MKNYYDVVVVGGGPAGLMSAKTCAENGLSVIVLEKDAEIGAPKRCGEGLSIHGVERAGLPTSGEPWIRAEIDGAMLYSPSGKSVPMDTGKEKLGIIIERKMFEKYLARLAIEAGAKCSPKTTATGLIIEGGKVVGVRANLMGDDVEYRCKIVLACDGVESKIGRMAGLRTTNKLKDYISGFQYEMAGISNLNMRMIHLWFGNEVAPKGYLWVFPKGDNVANVGIGIIGVENMRKNAKRHLDEFIESHPQYFEKASIMEVNAGGLPVSAFMDDTFVKDGLMLVGDSAQMVNPIHGGGMTTNMYAAKIAGRVAAEAIRSSDVSAKRLKAYEDEWKNTDGVRMRKLLKLRYFLEKLSDKDFEYFADVINSENLMDMQAGKTKFLLKMLIKHPKLLMAARKYLV